MPEVLPGVCPLAGCFAASLLLSWALETLLTPRPAPVWRRPWAANAVHAGFWLADFVFLLLLVRRPGCVVAVQFAQTALLVAVNHVKWRTLREPFIAQDFEYFTDLVRHPRLYLPFFGWWRAAGGLVLFVGACALGAWLEAPLAFDLRWLVAGVAGVALFALGAHRLGAVRFDAVADLRRLGLAASLWAYARADRRAPEGGWPTSPFDSLPPLAAGAPRPLLVAVQSESFFDPRTVSPAVRASVLAHFDALAAQSHSRGPLHVPCWGANTVRTEHAFLSGVAPARLGVHQFNPYRRAATSVGGIAHWLRAQGYRTVFVHPYPAGFYRRDQVVGAMGFDEFIDIAGFEGALRDGPYVSDMAVAEKVRACIAAAGDTPLFVFVVTMENHGPLHLERTDREDAARGFETVPERGMEELVNYVRHVANADRMVGALADLLRERKGPSALAFYGDHVPPMPAVYERMGAPEGTTEYLVWSSTNVAAAPMPNRTPCAAESLGLSLLNAAGLASRGASA